MRINNPRLFNGQLLASYENLAKLLGQNFSESFYEGTGISGVLSTSIIPISGVTAVVDNGVSVFPLFADTLYTDDTKTKTIAQALADVAQYDANISGAADGAISAKVDTVVEGIKTTDNFTVGLKLASGEKVLSQSADGLATTISLAKVATASGYAATYELQGIGGVKLGDTINIPQDQMLSGVQFVEGEGAGDDALKFIFYVTDPTGTTTTTQTVDVPLSGLFNEYTGVNGVSITQNAAGDGFDVKGVVDPNPANEFLTVGANGFMVSGVTDKIQAASGYALDEAKDYTDEVSGA